MPKTMPRTFNKIMYIKRLKTEDICIDKCVYCGDDATTKDHVIPVSFYKDTKRTSNSRYLTSDYGKENLVDCCSECNCIASNKVFDSIDEKRDYIQDKLSRKYKKVLNMPTWFEEDINKLGRNLKREVKIQQLAQKWMMNRINYPREIYPSVELNKEVKKFLSKFY
jgi:hypothetical protein